MRHISFTLLPHPQTHPPPAARLTGSVGRSIANLHLRYELSGMLQEIVLPEPAGAPGRTHGLWQSTCFELFIATDGSPGYWEINLAPSGSWNVYAFDGYRAGMREEAAVAALPFTVHRHEDTLQLELDLPLAQLIRPEQALALGISAVIQEKRGPRSFHALAHCGPQPDFHLRESFMLCLPPLPL